MKKTEIMRSISGSINKVGFKLRNHGPEILVVLGVLGTVTSAVMACKATTKVNDILEEAKDDIDVVHENAVDVKPELTRVYIKTGIELTKLYAPAVTLGVLSIGGIVSSNRILRKRNLALAAAYATVDKGFKEYRNRVIERFGEEVEHEIKHNITSKKIDTIVVDENGKEKKVKETIQVFGEPNEHSDYARFFDDGCTGWEKNAEYNLMFLRAQQQFANDKLMANGRLFLNEVYDMLGIPRTKAGQVVGWIYDPENPNIDNYVDFGIYQGSKEATRNFVNGYERTILLDFNVDGNIWKQM